MTRRGYFNLTTEEGVQTLHFSANAWYNLLDETDLQLNEFGNKLADKYQELAKWVDKGNIKKQSKVEREIADLLTELAYAAALAHDQEEGIEPTYNKFKVRSWITSLSDAEAAQFGMAMSDSVKALSKQGK